MPQKLGEGGLPTSHASVMQRVRNKNNMADKLLKMEIAEYEKQFVLATMSIRIEMTDLHVFMHNLRDCYTDDLSEYAPLFLEKYELARQLNSRAKRTRFKDLFSESEVAPRRSRLSRGRYSTSPSKSLIRSQTLPNIGGSFRDAGNVIERSLTSIEGMRSSGRVGRATLPDLVEENAVPFKEEPQMSRPSTKHKAKKMGIITEVEVETVEDSRTFPPIQVDSWGINGAKDQQQQQPGTFPVSSPTREMNSQGHDGYGRVPSRGKDMMRSMLDHKPRHKRRRMKKPLDTRIDEFFEEMEKLVATPVAPSDVYSPLSDGWMPENNTGRNAQMLPEIPS